MHPHPNFWQLSEIESLQYFNVSPSHGINQAEVENKIQEHGFNTLTLRKQTSKWKILILQFKSIIVLLLASATLVSFLLAQWIEAISILIVLIINGLIGFFTELKAVRSMEALRQMGSTPSIVLRNEKQFSIDSKNLVPGDIVLLEAGDIITADMRLIEACHLAVDESALTGESLPVDKFTSKIESENVILAEKTNMIFKGTFVTRGSAKGLTVATGMKTEIGKIAKLTEEAHEELTPLEKRLNKLGQQLVTVSLIMAFFIALAGVLAGHDLILMFETAIALAVATIPEGLPIVATMALAKGMWRMAEKNALINKLSAVETLGATSIIFVDKTGTLTENKMMLKKVSTSEGSFNIEENIFSEKTDNPITLIKCLEIGVMCNNASIEQNDTDFYAGDPMEAALLYAGKILGIIKNQQLKKYPEIREESFTTETKMMATFHHVESQIFVAVKGAPESILKGSDFILANNCHLPMSKEIFQKWNLENKKMAEDGFRVLAMAYKIVDSVNDDPYDKLIFCGLVGFIDPPRPEVKEAIASCYSAGIKIIMVTGDQAGTAKKIAAQVNLINDNNQQIINGDELGSAANWTIELKNKILSTKIFSRVSPQQKLDLIQFYQEQKFVVAMTGDGVNDAPALKKADIGIAMGKRGTQVAREAADMVLKDDSFSSIVAAVGHGRVIFSNIRRFVVYLLSCNISEVLVVSIAALANMPLPLLPLQILFLNLVTDVFPALALGMGEGDILYLKNPPRKKDEPIITKRKWRIIVGHGLVITFSVLSAFVYTLKGLKSDNETALTVSFLTLGMAQIFHIFNMKLTRSNFINNDITRNPHVWIAILICLVLLVGSVYLPGVSFALKLVKPSPQIWILILTFSLIPLLIGQIASAVKFGPKE